ncbi:MAG: carboxypeptidase regulatory-like domain-containing protein [Candidatus Hydrogenedentes bacterium]|nr:carboxypeptidase regulatory-like domain-containing protein [Candidatus Hydrogenedentota bacterium]
MRALANEYRQANGTTWAEFKPNARTCTVNIQLTPSPGADYRNETAMFASETADSSEDDAVPAASAPAPALAGFEGAAGGQVVYPDGSPLPGVLVAAGASRSTSDRQGRFHLTGLAGQRVQAQVAAYSATAPGGVLATLDVGRDDHRIEVRIPEFQVSGRVVDKSTREPVTQFYVGIGRPSNASRSDMSSENDESFVTSSDGSFLLAGLRAQYGANARLTIRAPGYAVATLPRVQVRPAPNDDAEPIVAALAPAAANTGFEGVVVDRTTGAPVPDALVVVNEIDALDAKSFPFSVWETTVVSYPRSQRTKTDSNGEFRFPDWCDTKGWVVVERNGYGRQWLRGIAFQSPFRIELDPEAVVSGAVTDSNGRTAPSAGVFIHYYEGDIQIWNQWVHVDESGAFTFRGLSPGRYRVNPTEVTGKKCEDWFTLSAGQTHEVRWH